MTPNDLHGATRPMLLLRQLFTVACCLICITGCQIQAGDNPDHQTGASTQRPTISLANCEIDLVLTDGLFHANVDDRKPLHIDLICRDGQWEKAWANAMSFNQSEHTGRVMNARQTLNGIQLKLLMDVNGDAWVKGGTAEYEITLKIQPNHQLAGTFKGQFRGISFQGHAKGLLMPLRLPPAGFQPITWREHPRILFRKKDLPALKARAKTPEGKQWVDAIRRLSERNLTRGDQFGGVFSAVAGGIMYQLTDDKSYAQRAKDQVIDMMADRTGGSFNLGVAWGPRLAGVGTAFDLCYDAWDPAFKQEVHAYLLSNGERCLLRPNSITGKFNFHPCSNYRAFMSGGAAIGALAIRGEQGPAPRKPADPERGPLVIGPAKDYQPGPGVPVVPLISGQSPKQWLASDPIMGQDLSLLLYYNLIDEVPDFLTDLGGRANTRPTPQSRFKTAGQELGFAKLPEKWVPKSGGIDTAKILKGKRNTTSYYYTVLNNDKPRLMQIQGLGNIVKVWLNGQRLDDHEFVMLQPGLYPMLVQYSVGHSWGSIHPVLIDRTPEQMAQTVEQWQRAYRTDLANWQRAYRQWQESGKAHQRTLALAKIGERHMARYYQYNYGKGGWQVEGEGYTLHSGRLPQEYAAAYRKCFGIPVSQQYDPGDFPIRYLMTTVYAGPNDVRVQSYGAGTSTLDKAYCGRCYYNVTNAWQPAAQWAWDRAKGPGDAVFNFLHYPLDQRPVNPGQLLPKVWEARTKGAYIFRDQWQGADDLVAQIFAKAHPGGGWTKPNAGDIRIYGLGHKWAINSPLDSKAGSRWFTNTVLIPEMPMNPGLGGEVTYFDARTDGSGVLSMDMRRVYADQRYATDQKSGQIRPMRTCDQYQQYIEDAFVDYGVRGFRSFGVDYSRTAGVPGLYVLVDHITGAHGPKIWQWQLPKAGEGMQVQLHDDGFTLRHGDTALRATFVAPSPVKLTLANDAQRIHLKYGQHGNVNLNAIHATTDADTCFVVMTLQRGKAPAVKVTGKGIHATATVGRQTISIVDGHVQFRTMPAEPIQRWATGARTLKPVQWQQVEFPDPNAGHTGSLQVQLSATVDDKPVDLAGSTINLIGSDGNIISSRQVTGQQPVDFKDLPVGFYRLQAELLGNRKLTVECRRLTIQNNRQTDLHLNADKIMTKHLKRRKK